MQPDIILWKSGCVKRWHNNVDRSLRESGDDTASHQWRSTVLLLMLHPLPSAHLLSCMLTHDVPEIVTGDTPGPMKVGLLGQALEALEAQTAEAFRLPVPSEKDRAWIDLCDKLDALLWMQEHSGYLMRTPEWMAARESVLQMAEALGVRDKVEAL